MKTRLKIQMNPSGVPERAQHELKQEAFIVFLPERKIMGLIKEISKIGLGIEYYDLEDGGKGGHLKQGDIHSVDIYFRGSRLRACGISCRVIHDDWVSQSPGSKFYFSKSRRCELEFVQLSKEQLEQLEYFITYYTASLTET